MKGRKKTYPHFVTTTWIRTEPNVPGKYRYLLRIPLVKNPTKRLLVILKNPSAASQKESDYTINKVLKYLYKNKKKLGYDEVIIANLFAYYAGKPQGMLGKSSRTIVGVDNDTFIQAAIEEADAVLVAWGGPTVQTKDWVAKYNDRIQQVLRLLNGKDTLYVGSVSPKGVYPLHAQVWGYSMKTHVFDVTKYIQPR